MRRSRDDYGEFTGYGFSAGAVNAQTVNINVTNVTHVVRYDRTYGEWSKRRHRHGERSDTHAERMSPRLLRHCASCGLLDQGVSYGMSEGQRCDEAVQVIRYASHGLGEHVDTMAKNAGQAASCFFGFAKCIAVATAALFR